jgi:hypothetical protein
MKSLVVVAVAACSGGGSSRLPAGPDPWASAATDAGIAVAPADATPATDAPNAPIAAPVQSTAKGMIDPGCVVDEAAKRECEQRKMGAAGGHWWYGRPAVGGCQGISLSAEERARQDAELQGRPCQCNATQSGQDSLQCAAVP